MNSEEPVMCAPSSVKAKVDCKVAQRKSSLPTSHTRNTHGSVLNAPTAAVGTTKHTTAIHGRRHSVVAPMKRLSLASSSPVPATNASPTRHTRTSSNVNPGSTPTSRVGSRRQSLATSTSASQSTARRTSLGGAFRMLSAFGNKKPLHFALDKITEHITYAPHEYDRTSTPITYSFLADSFADPTLFPEVDCAALNTACQVAKDSSTLFSFDLAALSKELGAKRDRRSSIQPACKKESAAGHQPAHKITRQQFQQRFDAFKAAQLERRRRSRTERTKVMRALDASPADNGRSDRVEPLSSGQTTAWKPVAVREEEGAELRRNSISGGELSQIIKERKLRRSSISTSGTAGLRRTSYSWSSNAQTSAVQTPSRSYQTCTSSPCLSTITEGGDQPDADNSNTSNTSSTTTNSLSRGNSLRSRRGRSHAREGEGEATWATSSHRRLSASIAETITTQLEGAAERPASASRPTSPARGQGMRPASPSDRRPSSSPVRKASIIGNNSMKSKLRRVSELTSNLKALLDVDEGDQQESTGERCLRPSTPPMSTDARAARKAEGSLRRTQSLKSPKRHSQTRPTMTVKSSWT